MFNGKFGLIRFGLNTVNTSSGLNNEAITTLLGCTEYVTIWNKWRNPLDKQALDMYYRHTIPVKCKFKNAQINTASSEGVIISNSNIVIIPQTSFYRPYKTWVSLTNDERKILFTLNTGDIVALGRHAIDISGIAPYRETDIRNKLAPNSFCVKSIVDNTRHARGKHYRIEGR